MKAIPSLEANLFERKQSKLGLILQIKININISDQQEPHMNWEKNLKQQVYPVFIVVVSAEKNTKGMFTMLCLLAPHTS